MLTIKILCVGNLKENYLKEAFLEYQKRLSSFCRFEVKEIPEHKVSSNPTESEINLAVSSEGEKLLSYLNKNNHVISLCIEGKEFSSKELSRHIQSVTISGKSTIVFIIGGSFGLSQEVKSSSNLNFSMSKLTFPHQLTRIMLTEQIYRAFQILSGGKYHK
ncbi:MAG: Ribosomal RNA large subunit methyltransferase H [Eubacteriales bacterium SKADARSKE-1]|nr:Ribosomal RNA large subunit methyltransferase H [Eubacteriales bacterium SKADARSKE-1]